MKEQLLKWIEQMSARELRLLYIAAMELMRNK